MKRSTLLAAMTAAGLGAASGAFASAAAISSSELPPGMPVAFIISENANVMDMAGPWETFQDVVLPDGNSPFAPLTVSDSTTPISATAGLRITPSFTFSNSPKPKVVVIGAQSGKSVAMLDYIRSAYAGGAIVMSVCTGAFKLALTGLLDGKTATTHHEFYDKFAQQFPAVRLVRSGRFIENGNIVTTGGLTSGIQGALHVVERLCDRPAAERTARYMEYVQTERPA